MAAWSLSLAACTGGFGTEPLVEYSTEINVLGNKPQSLTRQLGAGIYLVEVRERDIDLRVAVQSGADHRELGDAYLRHGLHRTVVSLDGQGPLRVTLTSIDQRAWRGAAAVRILRWPRTAADDSVDERLLGFAALGEGAELVARHDVDSWRAAIAPLRKAAAHFAAAGDRQALAEAEYQRGHVEHSLLHEHEEGRRTAQSALANFRAAGDDTGAQRAAMLLATNQFAIAAGMGPEVPEVEQQALLDQAARRAAAARAYFEARDLHSDAIEAVLHAGRRAQILGDYEECATAYRLARSMALMRGDRYFEADATSRLGLVSLRRGNMVEAVEQFEMVLPLIERDRNPELYATIISNLGHSLVSLGEFDRALVLHSEALELFSARGDESLSARELTALAAIQFRSGNVERALANIESALPLFERSRNPDAEVSALRLAGNAAAELGLNDLALEYLRRAERQDKSGIGVDRTRVLIAGELRTLGDFTGAEKLLAQVMANPVAAIRAGALSERAHLRLHQRRDPEAISDLRVADAIYASLKLDFNRIDTSSALALALLRAGDMQGAAAAADAAVAIERRIRVKSANPEMRARFLSASYAPYEALIEVSLAGAAAKDSAAVWKAFRVAETIRGRSLADRLDLRARPGTTTHDEAAERLREKLTALQMDLERHMREPAVSPPDLHQTRRLIDETRARLEARLVTQREVEAGSELAIPVSLDAVQRALPAGTAVLAYFVGDHRSHGWLLTRSELRHSTLPGRRVLQDLVNAFVESQRGGPPVPGEAAFAPFVGNLLKGVSARKLLVLADGPLHGLPFAALPLPHGRPHQLLIDRFVIAGAPSLALALSAPAHETGKGTRVAVISDPVYTPEDRRLAVGGQSAPTYRGADMAAGRFARLPYSAIEARAVVRAFESAEVIELAGFNATARRVIELPSRELGVLHFATHAIARRDAPEQSALFLSEYAADGSILAKDRLTADDIARSGLHADVVVLSGCATGDGRELRGEGVLGLAYGFLANGSRTVIASLWPVEDALTARFMEEFYRAYRASGSAADALRTAQLRTRGAAGSSVWSSFVIRTNGLP